MGIGALGGLIAGGLGATGGTAAAGGATAGLANLGSILGGIGGLAGGLGGLFGGGGSGGPGYEELDRDMQRWINWETAQTAQTQGPLQRDYLKAIYPQLTKIAPELGSLISQMLKSPGLPPELEQAVWNLAKQRLSTGSGEIERKLGDVLASNNSLRSGEAPQAWLDKVALPYMQNLNSLGVERALANYNAQQQSIGNAQSFLGMQPNFQGQYITPGQQTQQDSTDYAGLGSLFSKGLGMLTQNKTGTTPGATAGTGSI